VKGCWVEHRVDTVVEDTHARCAFVTVDTNPLPLLVPPKVARDANPKKHWLPILSKKLELLPPMKLDADWRINQGLGHWPTLASGVVISNPSKQSSIVRFDSLAQM